MDNTREYTELWATSRDLAQSYWNQYNQLIGPTTFPLESYTDHSSSETSNELQEETQSESDENQFTSDDEEANQEYLEFIEITRKHQLQRENQKEERHKLEPEIEEYYLDISQVNTLVEDNIARIPQRNKGRKKNLRETEPEDPCGLEKEDRDKIRSMEMYIDEVFKSKCQQLQPNFWPVIPLNPKPYLNKC